MCGVHTSGCSRRSQPKEGAKADDRTDLPWGLQVLNGTRGRLQDYMFAPAW